MRPLPAKQPDRQSRHCGSRSAGDPAIPRLHDSSQWRAALARNGWTDAYLDGDAFGQFVREESDRVRDVLADLGLG